ncbi:thiol oxidoreductase [bacterium]|nr:thiol oxidoreductase [bacterium]
MRLSLLIIILRLATPTSGASLGEQWSGGETTVFQEGQNAYSLPLANISRMDQRDHVVGNSFFNKNWIVAPGSPEARDGLGPLFNASSCSACHLRDGRGRPPKGNEPPISLLFRISIPGSRQSSVSYPEPMLGTQIATRAIPGIEPEGIVRIVYSEIEGVFEDGSIYHLRNPHYRLIPTLDYSVSAKNLMLSPRLAPPVFGLGLLEAIPEATLNELADPHDKNHDGISGRVNRVWHSGLKLFAIGRFGWKANQPNLRQQIAAAFANDLGITSTIHPLEPHSPIQASRFATLPNGGAPELSDRILQRVLRYQQTLAPPARRRWNTTKVRHGKQLFQLAQCHLCHIPELRTGEHPNIPALSNQTIRPFTDLLLHDMGSDLADGRPDFDASGNEWRTPPLWGIGLSEAVNGNSDYLHDGRARTLSEAILWHGGEAERSKEIFRRLTATERSALIDFLESL